MERLDVKVEEKISFERRPGSKEDRAVALEVKEKDKEKKEISRSETMDRKELGARLREAREYVGLSQDEVARYLSITRTAIYHIETGQRRVDAHE